MRAGSGHRLRRDGRRRGRRLGRRRPPHAEYLPASSAPPSTSTERRSPRAGHRACAASNSFGVTRTPASGRSNEHVIPGERGKASRSTSVLASASSAGAKRIARLDGLARHRAPRATLEARALISAGTVSRASSLRSYSAAMLPRKAWSCSAPGTMTISASSRSAPGSDAGLDGSPRVGLAVEAERGHAYLGEHRFGSRERPKPSRRSRSSGVHFHWLLGNFDGEVQDRRRASRRARPPVVQRNPVGQNGVPSASRSAAPWATRAVQAAVRHRDGDRDHLPLRRVQVLRRLVQLLVVGEPRAQPLGAEAVGSEDVGDEPDPLPRLPEEPLQILGQPGLLRDGEPANGYGPAFARDMLRRSSRLPYLLTERICCSE